MRMTPYAGGWTVCATRFTPPYEASVVRLSDRDVVTLTAGIDPHRMAAVIVGVAPARFTEVFDREPFAGPHSDHDE